jgi:hypothetical protein
MFADICKNALAYYNSGDLAVNSSVVGLAPELASNLWLPAGQVVIFRDFWIGSLKDRGFESHHGTKEN